MNLIDVHTHLNHKDILSQINEILARAKTAGLKAILLSGVNPENNRQVLQLCKEHPLLKASLGAYPIDALGLAPDESRLPRHKGKIDLKKEFQFWAEHKDEIVAIGEIGLDFNWADKEKTIEQQTENFRKIIQFAKKINKPIIIHSRKAESECLEILETEIVKNEIPVILHCFSGKKRLILKAKELGYYFSIPPNIVKLQHFQLLVSLVPIEQLLTETDSPWLSPFADRLNEPAFVIETIKKIAEIKEISVEETADIIWENYQKVFEK